MAEKDRKFSLFRKKEEEDKAAAEAKAEAKAGELADKKRREAAREKTDAEIRMRHEARMEAATKKKIIKHVVISGDTLSGIAKKYYDDAGKYMKIYEANKDVIGDDPSMIKPGMELVIPKL